MEVEEREPTFWVERLARLTGFDRLAVLVLDDERYAPYMFVLAATLLERPVPTVFDYFRGNTDLIPYLWWRWPGILWWLIPVVLLLGVFSLRAFRKRYDQALRRAGKSDDDVRIVEPGFPPGFQYAMLVSGYIVFGIWFSTAFNQIFGTNPAYTAIRWLGIIPIAYVPIATDLAAVYLQVQLVLPLRIREAEVELDFSDPRRLGGMYPVGRVMQFTAMAAFSALALYTIYWYAGFTIVPEITPPADRRSVIVVFALAWTLSIIVLTTGLYLVHQHMRSSRESQINRVLARTRDFGEDEEVFPYTTPGDESESRMYLQEYVNLNLVERTRTVPFNVAVTWELIMGALFPVFLQLLTLVLEPL